MPEFTNYIKRPRLNEALEKSLNQFGATLITGRAGTGKSALAADLAQQYEQHFWFAVSAADYEWNIFSSYLCSIFSNLVSEKKSDNCRVEKNDISPGVERLLSNLKLKTDKPVLVVLDDVHNVFDAEWFAEFFNILLYSLPANVHLLMLSRGNPPLPLWRMRSKQVLGILDEKMLAFNLEETKEFFECAGFPSETATQAHRKSFGRVSRLRKLAESV